MPEHSYKGLSVWRLLWSNLRARPIRSTISVVAIGLQVFLVLFVVGLTSGMLADSAKRVEGVGADLIVQPPNSSIFFVLSGAVIQESTGHAIANVPGVDEVAPVLILMDTSKFTVVYGIVYDRFNGLGSGFQFVRGRPFEKREEAIADDLVAQARKLKVGDSVTLLGHEFTISGIVQHGKGARFFIPLPSAQDIAGADKRVSMFYVRSKGDTEGTRAEIVKRFPSLQVRSLSEYMTLMNSSNLPELKPFIRAFVGLGVAISFLVVLLTMHTMVLERTREIGILKALGSSRGAILLLILGEALLMAALGIVVGGTGTYVVTQILKRAAPTLQLKIGEEWVLRAGLLAVVAALAGALYPASRAAQHDPVDALAYE